LQSGVHRSSAEVGARLLGLVEAVGLYPGLLYHGRVGRPPRKPGDATQRAVRRTRGPARCSPVALGTSRFRRRVASRPRAGGSAATAGAADSGSPPPALPRTGAGGPPCLGPCAVRRSVSPTARRAAPGLP